MFLNFYDEILVKFNKIIKILLFVDALEYTYSIMNSFCVDHGIIHQISSVQSLNKMMLLSKSIIIRWTLLAHCYLICMYQSTSRGDTFSITCQLIDHMPSTILNNKFPFSLLYPNFTLLLLM